MHACNAARARNTRRPADIRRDHLSLPQDDDRRADLLDHLEDVRAVEDDLPAGGERANELLQYEGGADVESGRRLVEQDDVRVVQQPGRDQDLLPHAFRIGREPCMPVVVDSEEAEKPLDLLGEHVGLDLAEPSDEREVFGTGQVGVQVGCLRHVPDAPPVAEDVAMDALAVDADLSSGRFEEPRHHVDGGRLARAVGSEIAEHLAGARREADFADRGERAVVLGDPYHLEHETLLRTGLRGFELRAAIGGAAQSSDRPAPRAAPAGGTRRPPRCRAAPRRQAG